MAGIELGYYVKVDDSELYTLKSKYFPNKVGGKPAWLSLKNLPKQDDLRCKECNSLCKFLLQIYSPTKEESGYHRSIFLFYCPNGSCSIKNTDKKCIAFRSQLPKSNEFYSYDSDSENEDTCDKPSASDYNKLCNVCGYIGPLHCGACKKVFYCGKAHQTLDWKQGHKKACKISQYYKNEYPLPEGEIAIEPEPVEKKVEDQESGLNTENMEPTMQDVPASQLEQFAQQEDVVFSKFKERISREPHQVLRYGEEKPLWVGKEVPANIPPCSSCGAPRTFLFQVMPQLLNHLHSEELDWGTLAVYICSKSCDGTDPLDYHPEYVWQQDYDDLRTMGIAVTHIIQAISRVNALGRVPQGLGGKAFIYLNYNDFETTKWISKMIE
ncbi:PDCD2 [Cordylochernes scorpioides]|uniref:PDCD2 n=1 Tax=Cordylochernes scorpioides TaxID=51811 RepID=A0ABY6L5E9_9ARAC|nr:PDCD2 [Cordylochernes scorpioides]